MDTKTIAGAVAAVALAATGVGIAVTKNSDGLPSGCSKAPPEGCEYTRPDGTKYQIINASKICCP